MRIPLNRMILMLLSAILTVAAASATAQTITSPLTSTILPDAVEEDWQLVVATPDPLGIGPQITTCMSPVSDGSAPFAAFDINYREYPTFQGGGLQIQVWSGSKLLDTSSQGSALFNTPGETVTWTQRMAISGGAINYSVNNGVSITFGKFGQGANLAGVSFPTTLASLANYSPNTSASASGVTWESNYVSSLTLVRVRYYANGQLLWTDTTPRTIVPSASTSTTP